MELNKQFNLKSNKLIKPCCGNVTKLLGWEGVPSPIAFIALIRNWYVLAAFKFSKITYRAFADMFVSSVTQSTSGSNNDWVSEKNLN